MAESGSTHDGRLFGQLCSLLLLLDSFDQWVLCRGVTGERAGDTRMIDGEIMSLEIGFMIDTSSHYL